MSVYEIKLGEAHIGRVAKFAGEPAERRWIAYSLCADPAEHDAMTRGHWRHKSGFPTRRAAVAWLEDRAARFPTVPS